MIYKVKDDIDVILTENTNNIYVVKEYSNINDANWICEHVSDEGESVIHWNYIVLTCEREWFMDIYPYEKEDDDVIIMD